MRSVGTLSVAYFTHASHQVHAVEGLYLFFFSKSMLKFRSRQPLESCLRTTKDGMVASGFEEGLLWTPIDLPMQAPAIGWPLDDCNIVPSLSCLLVYEADLAIRRISTSVTNFHRSQKSEVSALNGFKC